MRLVRILSMATLVVVPLVAMGLQEPQRMAQSPSTTVAPAPPRARASAPPPVRQPATEPAKPTGGSIVGTGLDAWSAFAATGDLVPLVHAFHPEGPQYAQLVSEAERMRTSTDSTDLEFAVVCEWREQFDGPIDAIVVVTSGDEERQVHWRFHLRDAAGEDRIWTVEGVGTPEHCRS